MVHVMNFCCMLHQNLLWQIPQFVGEVNYFRCKKNVCLFPCRMLPFTFFWNIFFSSISWLFFNIRHSTKECWKKECLQKCNHGLTSYLCSSSITEHRSVERFMFVCLQKGTKQCCDARILSRTHCDGQRNMPYTTSVMVLGDITQLFGVFLD